MSQASIASTGTVKELLREQGETIGRRTIRKADHAKFKKDVADFIRKARSK